MGFLRPKRQEPRTPPPVPQIDEAQAIRTSQLNSTSTTLRRMTGSTILTSDSGLPNLGSTTSPAAGGY